MKKVVKEKVVKKEKEPEEVLCEDCKGTGRFPNTETTCAKCDGSGK